MMIRQLALLLILTACGNDDVGTGTASSTTNASIRSAGAWVYNASTDALGAYRSIQLYMFSDPVGTACADRGNGDDLGSLLIADTDPVLSITNFTVAARFDYPRSIPDVLAVASSTSGQSGDVAGSITVIGDGAMLWGSVSGTATASGGATFPVELEFEAPICLVE